MQAHDIALRRIADRFADRFPDVRERYLHQAGELDESTQVIRQLLASKSI